MLILLIGILLTSIYPALWISSISTTSAINRRTDHINRRKFFDRKFLITFQFSISIALIIVTLVMYRQISFTMKKRSGNEYK